MEIQNKENEINNLTIKLDLLKKLTEHDYEKVKQTLNNHPQVQEALNFYKDNSPPRVPLTTEQETIVHLALEIKRINYDLKMAISTNLS